MKAIAVLVAFLIFLFCSSFAKPAFAVLLFSSDFENQNISGWTSSGGGASATISSELSKSGNYSLKVQHDKTSSYGYQVLIPNIEGGMFYQAQAFGKSSNTSTDSFFIRVAWYSSSDGSGSQLSTPSDSNQGAVSDDWVELKTGVIQAPSSANSAKFRLVLTSKSAGTLASAFFDDIVFAEATAPTPSPTLIPTPTSQVFPIPSPTKSPAPASNAASATPKPSTPAPSIAFDKSSEEAVLGESSVSATMSSLSNPSGTQSPKGKEIVLFSRENNIAKILIFLGFVFILACGILFSWPHIRNRFKKDE